MLCVFKERKIAAREVMILQGKESEKETWKAIKPDYFSSWTLIIAFFVLVFNFVLLETYVQNNLPFMSSFFYINMNNF